MGTEQGEHQPDKWPLGRLLGAASRAVERAWYEALEARGLTHAGLIVLHFVELGFDSQTDLARFAQVEAQTMSRTVDRLEREGLVIRLPDPADRRRHIVSITERGHAAFEAVQIAIRYRTPVILLSDTFLASSSEPWRIPSVSDLPASIRASGDPDRARRREVPPF